MKLALIFSLFLICSSHAGATNLTVSRVQLPAWVQRGSVVKPLTPGFNLQTNDVVRTGAGARLLLQMSEGSDIKLGENAQLMIGNLGVTEDKGIFKAALNVLQGAFRFTTSKVFKNQKRDVTVRIATVTAGIRGTDLWGKAAVDKDIVCLIEGHIAVAKEGFPEVEMKDPLSFYIAPKNKDPLPVAPVPSEKLKEWAQETEIANGEAVISTNGRWGVNVIDLKTQQEALTWYDKLRNAGFPAVIRTSKTGKVTRYHIRIQGLSDEQAANTLAERLHKDFGVSDQELLSR